MTALLDVHPLESRVGDFIAGLKALEKYPITTARISEFMTQMQPSPKALEPYLLWARDTYARNLIYRDHLFEVLVLCWLPDQRTRIHSHNGQLGWVTMVQGELVCRNYRFVRSRERRRPVVASSYRSSATRRVEVELLASATHQADGSVAVVDRRQQTTHQLENIEKSRHGSVSLHVYSKPIDSCVAFDESRRCWERRQLLYHSVRGVALEDAA